MPTRRRQLALLLAPTQAAAPRTLPLVLLCVPERFLPAPSVQDCVLGQTWKQLRALGRVFSTGGLGREMVVGEFEVWVCTRDSSCRGAAGAV